MFHTRIAAGALALLTVGLWTATVRASDVMRLTFKPDTAAQTMTLKGDTAETLEVHGYHHHGYYVAPRYYGYAYYRPYVGFAYYPRYWWGPSIAFGVGPVYTVIRPRAYFYAAPVYPYAVTIAAGASPSTTTLEAPPSVPAPPSEKLLPPRPVLPGDGTFPYNGGPAQPIPMPRAEPAPTRVPVPTAPLEGRAVSLPGKPGKLTYSAYGEDKVKSLPRDDTRRLVGK